LLELLTLLHFSNDCNAIEYPIYVAKFKIGHGNQLSVSKI